MAGRRLRGKTPGKRNRATRYKPNIQILGERGKKKKQLQIAQFAAI